MRLGRASSLAPPSLQPAIDRALRDLEQRRDPGPAQPAALTRQQHPPAQVGGIGSCHDRLPSGTPRQNGLVVTRLPSRLKTALDRRALPISRSSA
jgi:hypothetical protein